MKNRNTYYIKYWIPPVIYCLLIFGQSMLPISSAWIRELDKPAHFIVYMVLGLLIFRAFTTVSKKNGMIFAVAISIILSALISIADEFFQVFTPSRTVDPADIGFDLFGSAAGILLFLCFKLFFDRKDKPTSDPGATE